MTSPYSDRLYSNLLSYFRDVQDAVEATSVLERYLARRIKKYYQQTIAISLSIVTLLIFSILGVQISANSALYYEQVLAAVIAVTISLGWLVSQLPSQDGEVRLLRNWDRTHVATRNITDLLTQEMREMFEKNATLRHKKRILFGDPFRAERKLIRSILDRVSMKAALAGTVGTVIPATLLCSSVILLWYTGGEYVSALGTDWRLFWLFGITVTAGVYIISLRLTIANRLAADINFHISDILGAWEKFQLCHADLALSFPVYECRVDGCIRTNSGRPYQLNGYCRTCFMANQIKSRKAYFGMLATILLVGAIGRSLTWSGIASYIPSVIAVLSILLLSSNLSGDFVRAFSGFSSEERNNR